MPASPPAAHKPILLLAVASALTLVVGLVRTGERSSSLPRANHLPEASPEATSGRVPLLPTPSEDGAPQILQAAPPPAVEPAPVQPTERHELPRVSGLVLRPEGDPATDARVVLGKQHARCDADGRFELVLDGDGAALDFIAFEPGYEPVLRPAVGAGAELRIVLGPSTLSLTGTVLTRDGHPLKGWTVELDDPDPLADFGLRERVRTDADGRFVLPDLPAGIHVVRAFEERRELAFRSPPIAAGEAGLVILADPGE